MKIIITGLIAALVCGGVIAYLHLTRGVSAKPVWSFQFDTNNVDHYFTVDDGVLYCIAHNHDYTKAFGTLYAIDGVTGALLWKQEIEPSSELYGFKNDWFANVAQGLICYRDRNESVRALDAKTGVERWRASGILALLTNSIAGIYAINSNSRVVRLNRANGRITETADTAGSFFWTKLVITDKQRYFYTDGKLSVTSLETGRLLWTQQFDPFSFEMCVSDDKVFTCAKQTLNVYDGQTGNLLWSRPHTTALPVLENNVAYIGACVRGDEFVYGIDIETGKQLSAVPSENWTSAYNVFVADGISYGPLPKKHCNEFEEAILQLAEISASHMFDYGLTATDVRTGQVCWVTDLVCGDLSMPVISDGMVYVIATPATPNAPASLLAYRAGMKPASCKSVGEIEASDSVVYLH